MRIQHNIMAMNAYRNFNTNSSGLSKNLEKLSSGYRINRAGDDAAGLAISEKMRAQITGLDAAQKNVKDGISLVKTGEGAMQEIQDMLNRMSYLATQSANGTYDNEVDRKNLQKEVDALCTEIDRIADSTNFNGINLLDGSQSCADVKVDDWGETGTAAMSITFKINNGKTAEDLVGGTITVGTKTFTIELDTTASVNATGVTVDGSVIKISKQSTAEKIASAVFKEVGSVTVTVSGSGEKISLTGSLNGATITYKAATAGKMMAATDLPEMKAIAGLNLQIGDTSESYNKLNVGIMNIKTDSLFVKGIDISTQDKASKAVDRIKNAINMVSSTRGDLGAIQNRLEHTANNLSVMEENITDAESTIRDTDMADEMTTYTKNNILMQAAQAMLAQANQVPQGVLQLLQ